MKHNNPTTNLIIVAAVVGLVAGAAGFFGGMMRGTTGNRNGFRPVAGEIIKSDDTSITVKLNDGGSKIIMLSSSTRINMAAQGSKADLTTGTQVAIFGSENPDGSVTAQNVQINPMRGE